MIGAVAAGAVLLAGLITGIVVAGLHVAGSVTPSTGTGTAVQAASTTLTVTGSMELHDDDLLAYAGGCAGQGGYSDIEDGAAVTVTDASGAIVGLGRLSGSQLGASDECDFSFVVTGVPAGKGFYGIEVSHRGAVKYAEADLSSPVAVTLGL